MKRLRHSTLILVISAVLGLSACARGPEAASEKIQPATLEPLAGSDLHRIVLTEEAAQRIGVKTGAVREVLLAGREAPQKVVPFAAVIYETHGDTLMYVATERLAFAREAITVERIEGDRAILLDGPPPGTRVVIVGAAELYGIEFGIGK